LQRQDCHENLFLRLLFAEGHLQDFESVLLLKTELDRFAPTDDIFCVSTESIGGLEGRRSAWEHPFCQDQFPAKT